MYNALDSLFNPTRCAKLRAPQICNLEYFTPADYVKSLSLVSLSGLTGSIQFNVTQPDRRRANFDIYQYRSKGVSEQVGYWNITGPYLASDMIQFKTSPAYPISLLVPANTQFGDGFWPTIVAILAGLGIFAALCLLIFFTAFAGTRVVRRTNLLWIWLMFTGIILVLLSLIMWTLVQTTFICVFKSCLGMIGFGLITACIVVKTQRIFRVLMNTGNVSMVMGNVELLFVTFIVMIPCVILLFLYLFADGGLPDAVIAQSTVDNTYVFIACANSTTASYRWPTYVFVGYNLFLLLICAILFLVARNLQTAYDEAEFLFLVTIDFLILSAMLVPLYYTVGDRRGSVLQTFLLRSLAVLFAMILTIALVTYPKFGAIMARVKSKKQRDEDRSLAGTAGSGQAKYAEVPTTDESGSESDFTSAGSTGKPRFISQTYTHKSAGSTSGTEGVVSGTTGTKGSSGPVFKSSASQS